MAKPRLQGPPAAIEARLKAVRQRIQQKSLDGYLVTSRTDQFYLTGFDGEDGAALILPRQVYLLTDGRFEEEARLHAPWARAVIRKGPLGEALAGVTKRHKLARLGFQPESMTVASHKSFAKAVRPTRLVAAAGLATDLRQIKDETEVQAIERAIEVAEEAFKATVRRIRPGMRERDLAALLLNEMLIRGASGSSFPIIVAEGPNAALPHARPGDRKIEKGSAVLIDWGATVGQYRSDLTRVVFVHRIPPRFRGMYEGVLAAQEVGIRAVKPGARMCDVDAQARNVLREAGMGKQFSHSLGHGLGLDIHESPRLARTVTDTLQPGMVVTVEPGVYFPGVGGVRIEDDVLVTHDGCRVLSSLPKDLDSAVL